MSHFRKPKLSPKEEKLKEKVQHDIHYCLNCQPRDSGEWIWVLGEEYDLETLFDDHDVEKELRDKIAEHLVCPNCGTDLGRYDDIGLEDSYDKKVKEHIKKALAEYGEQIDELSQGIKLYPTLGLKYPLGNQIFEEIKKKNIPTCSIHGEYYRARKINSSKVFQLNDFLAPPLGKPEEGRFNHAGQSHFYISDQKETAVLETLQENEPSLVWLQSFKLKRIGNILDLTYKWHDLGPSASTLLVALHQKSVLQQSDENTEKWKPDYNLTRFIMDCAKMCGYKGIKYKSAKRNLGNNVVLFNCSKDLIIKYENPNVIVHDPVSKEDQLDELFSFEDFS